MKLLVQNSKMKKSSSKGVVVVNWTIPAFLSKSGVKTCPNAGVCAAGCYARGGAYMFSNVNKVHEEKLQLTFNPAFIALMVNEIQFWLNKKGTKKLYVRIHDSGDFYSVEYLKKWLSIISQFENDGRVEFYAYTKMVNLFKDLDKAGYNQIPENLVLIYSFGGKQDALIGPNDRHSKVFNSLADLKNAGYIDASHNDLLALGENPKIGLVYHGAKNFENTLWSKVS